MMEAENKKKILYAEDELSVYTLACRALNKDGNKYDIVNAANLDEAISLSEKENFDLYITDGEYPSKGKDSGLEFCKHLKNKHDGKAKILFVSSLSGNPDFIRNVRSIDKNIKCIRKPYYPTVLRGLVNYMLNHNSQ